MTLAEERDAQIARALGIAESMPGEDLPGWVVVAPGPDSWAPRLVHTRGAAVMVTCLGGRVYFRGVRPDGLDHHRWTSLEISVAADAARGRLVSHFTRRLAAPLLDRHAAALEVVRRQDEAAAARAATCARLRAAVPARMVDRPWPADVHDVRLTGIGPGCTSGRVRVTSPDRVDLTLEGVTAEVAEALLRALADRIDSQNPPAEP